jgi:hypothetical protein
LVTAFTLCDRETTFHDFQSELLSQEILLQNQQSTLTPEAVPLPFMLIGPNHLTVPQPSETAPTPFANPDLSHDLLANFVIHPLTTHIITLPCPPEILLHHLLMISLPTTHSPPLLQLHDSTLLVKFVAKVVIVPWIAIIAWTTLTNDAILPCNLLP